MTSIASPGLLIGLSISVAAATAQAQSMAENLGKFEFMNSCAVCHGESGNGNGPMLDQLTNKPADLTKLQADNGGVFPVAAVFDIIAGDNQVGAHGTSEMPAWGQRFSDRVEGDIEFIGEAREAYVRTRVLALIEYISTLQQ